MGQTHALVACSIIGRSISELTIAPEKANQILEAVMAGDWERHAYGQLVFAHKVGDERQESAGALYHPLSPWLCHQLLPYREALATVVEVELLGRTSGYACQACMHARLPHQALDAPD